MVRAGTGGACCDDGDGGGLSFWRHLPGLSVGSDYSGSSPQPPAAG